MNAVPVQIKVATWNIHKGVRGIGPRKRLEIHDMVHAVETFDADIVCLQEVRKHHHKDADYFTRWPDLPQADYLAPEGYEAVYRSNAVTRHGEHGNALLSRWPVGTVRHEDMSDHRFEQRGLLHAVVHIQSVELHVIVVHLGLIAGSRRRQLAQLDQFVRREIATNVPLIVAGDFNDWGERLHQPMQAMGFQTFDSQRLATFPSRTPLLHLDRVYARGLHLVSAQVPHGRTWARMSDHLPLIATLELY
jgi:endonuclease/exonuclease/phosphatase family metal-dependent hydrolase